MFICMLKKLYNNNNNVFMHIWYVFQNLTSIKADRVYLRVPVENRLNGCFGFEVARSTFSLGYFDHYCWYDLVMVFIINVMITARYPHSNGMLLISDVNEHWTYHVKKISPLENFLTKTIFESCICSIGCLNSKQVKTKIHSLLAVASLIILKHEIEHLIGPPHITVLIFLMLALNYFNLVEKRL